MDNHGNVHVVESDEEFDAIVSTADKLVVVDFYADWCGPCKRIAPLFAQYSLQYTGAIFLKVNVDVLKMTSMKCGIQAMPTFQFFKGGQKIHEFRGANTTELENSIRSLSGSNSNTSSQPSNEPNLKKFKYFPQELYIVWDNAKMDVIVDKILQANSKMTAEQAMNTTEISNFNKLVNTLKNASMYHTTKFSEAEFAVMTKLITWPPADRFPVLDILRLLTVHPEGSLFFSKNTSLINAVVQSATDGNAPFQSIIMTLRFIANGYKHEVLRKIIVNQFSSYLTHFNTFLKHENKQVRLALYTVLLNHSIFYCDNLPSSNNLQQATNEMRSITQLLLQGLPTENEEESVFRIVVALGNVAWVGTVSKCINSVMDSSVVVQALANSATVGSKVAEAKMELSQFLTHGFAFQPSSVPNTTPQMPQVPQMAQVPQMPQMPSNLDPALAGKLLMNPQILQALQNPTMMAKVCTEVAMSLNEQLQNLMANPASMAQYQNDPEFLQLLQAMSSIMSNK